MNYGQIELLGYILSAVILIPFLIALSRTESRGDTCADDTAEADDDEVDWHGWEDLEANDMG